MSIDYARKLHTLGRSHGMGASRLWARALEDADEAGIEDIALHAFNGPLFLSINLLAGRYGQLPCTVRKPACRLVNMLIRIKAAQNCSLDL